MSETSFPAGDCRNPWLSEVTGAQARDLARAFERQIHPFVTKAFDEMPSAGWLERDATRSSPMTSRPTPTAGRPAPRLRRARRPDPRRLLHRRERRQRLAERVLQPVLQLVDRPQPRHDERLQLAVQPRRRRGADRARGPLRQLGPTSPYHVEATLAHEYFHDVDFHLHGGGPQAPFVNEGLAEWVGASFLNLHARPDAPGWTWHLNGCFLVLAADVAPLFDRGVQQQTRGFRRRVEQRVDSATVAERFYFSTCLAATFQPRVEADARRRPGHCGRGDGWPEALARQKPAAAGGLVAAKVWSVALDGVRLRLDDGAKLQPGAPGPDVQVRAAPAPARRLG